MNVFYAIPALLLSIISILFCIIIILAPTASPSMGSTSFTVSAGSGTSSRLPSSRRILQKDSKFNDNVIRLPLPIPLKYTNRSKRFGVINFIKDFQDQMWPGVLMNYERRMMMNLESKDIDTTVQNYNYTSTSNSSNLRLLQSSEAVNIDFQLTTDYSLSGKKDTLILQVSGLDSTSLRTYPFTVGKSQQILENILKQLMDPEKAFKASTNGVKESEGQYYHDYPDGCDYSDHPELTDGGNMVSNAAVDNKSMCENCRPAGDSSRGLIIAVMCFYGLTVCVVSISGFGDLFGDSGSAAESTGSTDYLKNSVLITICLNIWTFFLALWAAVSFNNQCTMFVADEIAEKSFINRFKDQFSEIAPGYQGGGEVDSAGYGSGGTMMIVVAVFGFINTVVMMMGLSGGREGCCNLMFEFLPGGGVRDSNTSKYSKHTAADSSASEASSGSGKKKFQPPAAFGDGQHGQKSNFFKRWSVSADKDKDSHRKLEDRFKVANNNDGQRMKMGKDGVLYLIHTDSDGYDKRTGEMEVDAYGSSSKNISAHSAMSMSTKSSALGASGLPDKSQSSAAYLLTGGVSDHVQVNFKKDVLESRAIMSEKKKNLQKQQSQADGGGGGFFSGSGAGTQSTSPRPEHLTRQGTKQNMYRSGHTDSKMLKELTVSRSMSKENNTRERFDRSDNPNGNEVLDTALKSKSANYYNKRSKQERDEDEIWQAVTGSKTKSSGQVLQKQFTGSKSMAMGSGGGGKMSPNSGPNPRAGGGPSPRGNGGNGRTGSKTLSAAARGRK